MADLDFSVLAKLSFGDFTEDAPPDRSLSCGGEPLLEASVPSETSTSVKHSAAPLRAVEGKSEAFVSVSGGRDYDELYRAAEEWHRKHAPPPADRDYWRTHTAGKDIAPQSELDYWVEAARDMGELANAYNDPFLTGLLSAVYEELGREYDALRENAYKKNTA